MVECLCAVQVIRGGGGEYHARVFMHDTRVSCASRWVYFHLSSASPHSCPRYQRKACHDFLLSTKSKMRYPPLSVIESWPTPDYENPARRGPENIILNLIFFPLVCMIIAIRLYTRLRITKSFGVDDWLIVASWVSQHFTTPFIINKSRFLPLHSRLLVLLQKSMMDGVDIFGMFKLTRFPVVWNSVSQLKFYSAQQQLWRNAPCSY